ncbi:MAG: hypothetical protein KDA41_02740, partial [Planctomycetales bacterium]|nr:hypothetical protein [Planctomycetales bacterium]
LLLTLKMLEKAHYRRIGDYMALVRSWGYQQVRVRQLAFNRQEVTLAALKSKALLRQTGNRSNA